MSTTHSIYGLQVLANKSIPGLFPMEKGVSKPDVKIWMGVMPSWFDYNIFQTASEWYRSPFNQADGKPTLIIWTLVSGKFLLFSYADGTMIFVSRHGDEIWATWPDGLTIEDTATYLLGPVLGFLMRLRGQVCLHASAFSISGKAVALVGPSGAGKSTTAAALAQMGYRIVSEDVVALSEFSGKVWVQPGYPTIRLWRASTEALFGSQDVTSLLTPNWDKRGLLLNRDSQFQQCPLPLAGIYILGERHEKGTDVIIRQPSILQSLIQLVGNTYGNGVLDKSMRAQEFNFLGKLLPQVIIKEVKAPDSFTWLPRFCQSIVDDFEDNLLSNPGRSKAN